MEKKWLIAALIVIILSFIVSIFVYPLMPEKMISHWNYKGEADGFSSKFIALFLMPIISLAILLILPFIINLDPLKKNIMKFKKYYYLFIFIIIFFFFYIHIMTILANVGLVLDFTQFLTPALAILFFFTAVLIEKSKRNWFIGIRTPWTLYDDRVWNKTHKLGGKLVKICAIIAILGIFFKNYSIILIIAPITIVMIYLIVYSYLEYKKIRDSPIRKNTVSFN